ncbi:hypothetical protein [Nonomuraea bangladeshensis]|uniref:hypothetical protein n=1 Tax=Nonomuraea bangladeshensis TaxID=404385 RepID=UPI003C2CDD2C
MKNHRNNGEANDIAVQTISGSCQDARQPLALRLGGVGRLFLDSGAKISDSFMRAFLA